LAIARLPQEVQQQGLSVKKKSSAMLQVISLRPTSGAQDPLFISNYATINILDELKRIRGVGDALMLGPLDYSMRIWFETDPLTGLGLTPGGGVAALQRQKRGGGGRSDRGAADQQRRLLPAEHQYARPAGRHGRVRRHHRPRECRRLGA